MRPELQVAPAPAEPVGGWVEAARSGDASAWRELFLRFQPRLTAYCLLYARGRRDLALDWTQDVFALALQRLHQLDDGERFGGWLFAIARRHCLRHARQPQRERELADTWSLLLLDPEPAERWREAAEREAWLETVRGRCQDLEPPLHRECVLAHYGRGEKTREIAARLGMPHGTVTVVLMRFRQRLQRELAAALVEGAVP